MAPMPLAKGNHEFPVTMRTCCCAGLAGQAVWVLLMRTPGQREEGMMSRRSVCIRVDARWVVVALCCGLVSACYATESAAEGSKEMGSPMMSTESAVPVGPENIGAVRQSSAPQPVPGEEDLVEIKSPIVGTFYATPSPDSESYVDIDSVVGPQTVVCIIEAMKVMNEIKAETNGTIVEILVTNGQAVEYGQVLFKVRPD